MFRKIVLALSATAALGAAALAPTAASARAARAGEGVAPGGGRGARLSLIRRRGRVAEALL